MIHKNLNTTVNEDGYSVYNFEVHEIIWDMDDSYVSYNSKAKDVPEVIEIEIPDGVIDELFTKAIQEAIFDNYDRRCHSFHIPLKGKGVLVYTADTVKPNHVNIPIYNIKWDPEYWNDDLECWVDVNGNNTYLPKNMLVAVPESLKANERYEHISEYISDKTGWLHEGFAIPSHYIEKGEEFKDGV